MSFWERVFANVAAMLILAILLGWIWLLSRCIRNARLMPLATDKLRWAVTFLALFLGPPVILAHMLPSP